MGSTVNLRKTGTMLAPSENAAYPTWASTLPLMGRICFISLILVCTHMCKFCTCDIFIQFTLLEDVSYMARYYSTVSSEQFSNLTLCKPHGIFLQLYFKLGVAIVCRI